VTKDVKGIKRPVQNKGKKGFRIWSPLRSSEKTLKPEKNGPKPKKKVLILKTSMRVKRCRDGIQKGEGKARPLVGRMVRRLRNLY